MSRFNRTDEIPPLETGIPPSQPNNSRNLPTYNRSVCDSNIISSINVLSEQMSSLSGKIDRIEAMQKAIVKDMSDIKTLLYNISVVQGGSTRSDMAVTTRKK